MNILAQPPYARPDRVPTRRDRWLTRATTLHHLAVVGEGINTPPLPKDAIAYIATFLIHATLPYKDPGDTEVWTRRSAKYSVTFEAGHTPADRDGKQRKVALPFGVYPRLIFSWFTTQAVLKNSPDVDFGPSFTEPTGSGPDFTSLRPGDPAARSLSSASR